MNTIEFVERAKLIHGEKYDYSLVNYTNTKNKVKIVCPIHGAFEQAPYSHLSGRGCRVCGYAKNSKNSKNSLEEFVKKAKQIHGNKYDYSLVNYINNKTKVKVICNKCKKIFEQRPDNHLNGQNCPYCNGSVKLTTEQFIQGAKQIHGEKYDYSLVNYINKETKVKIICPIHGIFEQSYNAHVYQKHDCPYCSSSRPLTTESFVERARQIHGDKYDYNLTNYINGKTKVKIICQIHGIFEQTPSDHLNGHGCGICNSSKGEIIISNFLQKNNFAFIKNKKFKNLKDKYNLSYDFYLPSRNLLIEYNGIQHYYNSFSKPIHEFHKQLHHDWLKRKYARDNNINFLTISYKDDIISKLEKILNKQINPFDK